MEQIISYLVSTLITIASVSIIVLTKKGYDVLKEKANGLYDESRNTKIAELLDMVFVNIDDSIKAFFAENDIADITEVDLKELLVEVEDRVDTLTGEGVIDYLMSQFVDNWEDWIREKILARVTEMKNS